MLVLYGGENVRAEDAQLAVSAKVVLIVNERTAVMKTTFTTTVWAPAVNYSVAKDSLGLLRPSANADDIQWAANNAHGDLRKALINIDFRGSRCDQARHVYYDVLDVLANGKK